MRLGESRAGRFLIANQLVERRRHGGAELLDEQPEVVFVSVAPLITQSEAELKLRAETTHLPTADLTDGLKVLGGIPAPCSPAVRELLPAVLRLIEEERMEVDLTPSVVTHDESTGEPGLH